ncbi:MAG: diacylglycerol kinase [Beijerinckiaceae bacterium]
MQRIIAAYNNSRRALGRAFHSESAVREEMYLLLVAIPLALIIADETWKRIALIGVILIVLAVELLNTAIEKLCDRLHPDQHELIGYVKDLGSAAVLMMLLLTGMVWITSLWQWLDRVL